MMAESMIPIIFLRLFYKIYNTNFNTITDDELDELKQSI